MYIKITIRLMANVITKYNVVRINITFTMFDCSFFRISNRSSMNRVRPSNLVWTNCVGGEGKTEGAEVAGTAVTQSSASDYGNGEHEVERHWTVSSPNSSSSGRCQGNKENKNVTKKRTTS